jgi:uncharacterized membrane protein SpoIIM required for sporulation
MTDPTSAPTTPATTAPASRPAGLVSIKSVEFRREREESWEELDRLVTRFESKGPSSLSSRDLSRLPSLYRGALSALSVARAISLDRGLVEYLDALCVRAYGCVYGVRRGFFDALLELLSRQVPRVVRARRTAVLLSAATLVLGIAVGWATTAADPERFYSYVPEALADDRGPHASTESLRAVLYHRVDDANMLGVFATFLFTHNASTGFLSVVSGVLGGLPTAILGFWNGLIGGAFIAVYQSRGLGFELVAWMLPHGVPELTALVLCGGAGFAIAGALLFPGRRTRRASLSAAGRDAGVLAVGAVALDFVAALLEGIVRQQITDPIARLSIAFVMAVVVGAWLVRGGRAPASREGIE